MMYMKTIQFSVCQSFILERTNLKERWKRIVKRFEKPWDGSWADLSVLNNLFINIKDILIAIGHYEILLRISLQALSNGGGTLITCLWTPMHGYSHLIKHMYVVANYKSATYKHCLWYSSMESLHPGNKSTRTTKSIGRSVTQFHLYILNDPWHKKSTKLSQSANWCQKSAIQSYLS